MKNLTKITTRNLLVLSPLILAIAGCASPELQRKVDDNVARSSTENVVRGINTDGVKGSAQDIQSRADMAQNVQTVRQSKLPWIGGSMVPVTVVDGLPALFDENLVFDFGDSKVALSVVATRLTKITGLPVRVRVEPVASAATAATPVRTAGGSQANNPTLPGTAGQTGASVPAGAAASVESNSVDSVAMKWQGGKLRDFLDYLTNTLNLSWEYRDGAVVIASNVIESHPVAGMVGTQTFDNTVGNSAVGSAGGGGSSSSLVGTDAYTDKGKIDTYEAIFTTVRNIVGTGRGRSVAPDASTGSIVVSAPKDVQGQVRDYLREKNKILSRMINVTMDIYTIKETEGDQQGLNWNVVFNNLAKSYSIRSTSPATLAGVSAGSFTLTSLAGDDAGTSAVWQALRSTGKSVQHKPLSMTTLNGQLKVQSSTSTQGYVKETTPGVASSSGAAGAPGLKTDTVTTGDVFSVLPIIQPDNAVSLKYTFRLSNLLRLDNFTSGTGSNAQTVQVPQTDSVGDSSRVRLAPGEALMITGLSRLLSSGNNARIGDNAPMIFGGSTNNSLSREHFIVVLRATPL
jgi:type IVB pilus formation R64 PilN family outer membrane protein